MPIEHNIQHMGVSKIGVPQNGWFIMENPVKMDDLGVPLFLETPILQTLETPPKINFLLPAVTSLRSLFFKRIFFGQLQKVAKRDLPSFISAQ